jgi:hypothetical protein
MRQRLKMRCDFKNAGENRVGTWDGTSAFSRSERDLAGWAAQTNKRNHQQQHMQPRCGS